MAYNRQTIHVRDDDDIARLLNEADSYPVRLEKGGITYSLKREDDSVTGTYDPVAVRDAVRAASSVLTPDEGEELKTYLYRARQEGSRPANRP